MSRFARVWAIAVLAVACSSGVQAAPRLGVVVDKHDHPAYTSLMPIPCGKAFCLIPIHHPRQCWLVMATSGDPQASPPRTSHDRQIDTWERSIDCATYDEVAVGTVFTL